MPVLADNATWNDLVREVGKEFGHEVTDDEAGMILWEHTGFPSFWEGDPVACCTQQLREFFAGISPVDSMFATSDEIDAMKPTAFVEWKGLWHLKDAQWTRLYQTTTGVIRVHFGPTVSR